MSSTEQMEQLVRRAAGSEPGEPPVDALLRRARHRRLRRRLAAGTSAVALLTVGVLVLGQLDQIRVDFEPGEQGQAATLPRPAPGQTSPEWLPDATPVFVVAGEDGTVTVVEAVTTRWNRPDTLVGWCATSRTFSEYSGREWGPGGHYFAGPAETGLATYTIQLQGDRVVVGDRQASTSRKGGEDVRRAGPSCIWPLNSIGPSAAHRSSFRHTPEEAPWPNLPPEELAEHTGPAIVTGTVAFDENGVGLMCTELLASRPPQCPPDSPQLVDPDPQLQNSAHTGTYVTVAHQGRVQSLVGFGDITSEYFGPRPPSYSNAHPITVRDGAITVPAVDIAYGRPPDDPIPAGRYQLVLTNHGLMDHTLVNDDLDVDLLAEGGEQAGTTVEMPPGDYTFSCRIHGDRDSGMMQLQWTVQ